MKKKGNILTIAKKEFARFFKDKGLVFSTILLPGLMIYVMYTFMGSAMSSLYTVEDDFQAVVYMQNEPETFKEAFSEVGFVIKPVTEETDVDALKSEISNKHSDINLIVLFPEDFDNAIKEYDSETATTLAPNIEIYYNSASTESDVAYNVIYGILDAYEDTLTNRYDINRNTTINEDGEVLETGAVADLATKEDTTGQIFASMLPMLMMIFLFSGCMGVAPESIAGEKERGTIATLLVTPMNRGQLAIGKVISLGVIALLSGLSSFIGTFASLPSLMGGADTGMDASIYGVTDFVMLFGVILSTVLLIVGLICVISTFAKSVKEAGSLITPLMIISMVIGITAMFGNGAQTDVTYYLIPLYNSVQSMIGVFLRDYSVMNIMTNIGSNLVYVVILVFVLSKMFNNEKIMFRR